MCINHGIKAVQIWCTQEERGEDGFLNKLQKVAGYKTVIYVSGTQPVADLTAGILKHNVNL